MPPKKYTVTVSNETGGTKRYALFSEPPDIQWTDQKVWSTVFANALVATAQTAQFEISNQYYACIGNFDKDPQDDDGASFIESEMKQVGLGSKRQGGAVSRGTSVEMIVAEEEGGIPMFEKDKATNNGPVDGFEFITRGDFTLARAQKEKLMIGLGATNGYTSPLAAFVPEPSTYYSIRPPQKFRLIVGGYTQGALVDVAQFSNRGVVLDFKNKENLKIDIRHDDRGQLVVII